MSRFFLSAFADEIDPRLTYRWTSGTARIGYIEVRGVGGKTSRSIPLMKYVS